MHISIHGVKEIRTCSHLIGDTIMREISIITDNGDTLEVMAFCNTIGASRINRVEYGECLTGNDGTFLKARFKGEKAEA